MHGNIPDGTLQICMCDDNYTLIKHPQIVKAMTCSTLPSKKINISPQLKNKLMN
jgi:hypothetical protein